MALSTQLATATRRLIAAAARGEYATPELVLVRPLLELQRRWSGLPAANEWLVEAIATREGHGLFFYPFEGRLAHLGLATLFSYRLSRATPRTFSLTANDYGFGLLSSTPVPLTIGDLGRLLAASGVEADILAGLNAAELGRRQFREIARVAGLVFQGYPGEPNPARHLQASSALLYEVFAEFDADNLLLKQAVREVLERRLEAPRIAAALARLRGSRVAPDAPRASHAVRVSAAGRDVSRGIYERGARSARGPDGRGARARRGGDLADASTTVCFRDLRKAVATRCRRSNLTETDVQWPA